MIISRYKEYYIEVDEHVFERKVHLVKICYFFQLFTQKQRYFSINRYTILKLGV